MRPPEAKTTYRNQAAQRVLAVLDAFASAAGPLGGAELMRSLGMSKSMVHRALTILEEEGYLARDKSGRLFQLGPRILTFASPEGDDIDISTLCRTYMQSLHELTGESVFLGIIVGSNRVTIDKIEGVGRRVAHSPCGLAIPLHVSKTSRVLLAYQADADIETYLRSARPLSEFGHLFEEARRETLENVWSDIRKIRREGYIAWTNPQQYGGTYLAFPVLDAANRAHAVISIGAPIERFPPQRVASLLPQIRQIIAQLQVRSRLQPAPPLLIAPDAA